MKSTILFKTILNSRLGLNIQMFFDKELAARIQKENNIHENILRNYGRVKGKVAFDIGASLGQLTDVYSSIGMKVICVEPDIFNNIILKRKFRNNKNIKIINVAVSDSVSQVPFYRDPNGTSLHTISEKQKTILESSNTLVKPTLVETVTLDSLIKTNGIPTLIKLDIEGNEEKAFAGLSYPVPIIIFECNLPDYRKESLRILEKLVKLNSGYLFNFFDGNQLVFPSPISISSAKEFLLQTSMSNIDTICTLKD